MSVGKQQDSLDQYYSHGKPVGDLGHHLTFKNQTQENNNFLIYLFHSSSSSNGCFIAYYAGR
jgi:hypothetical protein